MGRYDRFYYFHQVLPSPCPGQVRSYYVDWRMLRDVKRRKIAYEYADERLRINAIRKNSILPKELQVPAAGSAQPGHGPTQGSCCCGVLEATAVTL